MASKRTDDAIKQRCFRAELIHEVAVKGFTKNRKIPPKQPVWTQWNLGAKSFSTSI